MIRTRRTNGRLWEQSSFWQTILTRSSIRNFFRVQCNAAGISHATHGYLPPLVMSPLSSPISDDLIARAGRDCMPRGENAASKQRSSVGPRKCPSGAEFYERFLPLVLAVASVIFTPNHSTGQSTPRAWSGFKQTDGKRGTA
jgi:hypothetical protein